MFTAQDHQYMSRALQLARRGQFSTRPNPAVGCVLVRGGDVVGEGWHQRAGGPHAEIHALQMAGALAKGATAYVTLEPCSHTGKTGPCADALIQAGVSHVIAAVTDPNPQVAGTGLARCEAAGLTVASGLLAAEASELNAGFFKRMSCGHPRLFAKIASSLDGRSAMASGESKWITGEAARADVQRLRASACAVMTGIGTVLADDPQLNVRAQEWLDQIPAQPVRVVLDSQLRLPADAQMAQGLAAPDAGRVVILTTDKGQPRMAALQAQGLEVINMGGSLKPEMVMDWLGQQGFNTVMLEAGATLNGAFLAGDLLDEVVLYQAPHIMGDAARGLFHLPELSTMQQRKNLVIRDCRMLGADVRFVFTPQSSDHS